MNMYPNDGYCAPRPPYDHVQSPYISPPGSERYVQYYSPPAAPPGNSYSNVVSRGKDVAVGKKYFIVTLVNCVQRQTQGCGEPWVRRQRTRVE